MREGGRNQKETETDSEIERGQRAWKGGSLSQIDRHVAHVTVDRPSRRWLMIPSRQPERPRCSAARRISRSTPPAAAYHNLRCAKQLFWADESLPPRRA